MLPKVTMKAPAGVGGQIHASASLKNYDVGPDGTVTVDAVDVPALAGAGFAIIPSSGTPRTKTPVPITSESLTSDTQGAMALDPKVREASLATQAQPVQANADNSKDFGAAMPPHGVAPKVAATNVTAIQHQEGEAALAEQTKRLSAGNVPHGKAPQRPDQKSDQKPDQKKP